MEDLAHRSPEAGRGETQEWIGTDLLDNSMMCSVAVCWHRGLTVHARYPPQRQANQGRHQRPDQGQDPRLSSNMHLWPESLYGVHNRSRDFGRLLHEVPGPGLFGR